MKKQPCLRFASALCVSCYLFALCAAASGGLCLLLQVWTVQRFESYQLAVGLDVAEAVRELVRDGLCHAFVHCLNLTRTRLEEGGVRRQLQRLNFVFEANLRAFVEKSLRDWIKYFQTATATVDWGEALCSEAKEGTRGNASVAPLLGVQLVVSEGKAVLSPPPEE